MISIYEVTETNQMIAEKNLDVRTITLGISLLDCCDNDLDVLNEKIYKKSVPQPINRYSDCYGTDCIYVSEKCPSK